MSSPTESTTSTTCIEDLPPEMISELFKHLPPEDLAACSLVNKRWHSIYAAFKVHSLAITRDVNVSDEWYHSNQPFQQAERCLWVHFYGLLKKPLLSHLKHLALYKYEIDFDLNKLNRFRQLVHLEFNITLRNKKLHLNLPRLKVLALHRWNEHCALSIDCPLLSTLLYSEEEDANLLEVKRPETIRKLETNMVDTKLAPFKGVNYLIAKEFAAISKATLLLLPELRELHFLLDIEYIFWKDSTKVEVADRVKRTLSGFVNEARKLRGSDFRFTLAGFELTKVDVEQIDFGVQIEDGEETVSNEYIYMKNYHLIEPGAIDFIYYVDYTDLLRHVTGEFPRCFSQKWTSIGRVYASAEVQDPDHFLWFLKSLRSLRILDLEETGLGQEFFDQLAASALSLRSLFLQGGYCEDGLHLNFDFVGEFLGLSNVEIGPDLSLESFRSIVRSLGRLKSGHFDVRSRERFRIDKQVYLTKWTISKNDQGRFHRLFETENEEEISNFFDGLQEDTPERSSD